MLTAIFVLQVVIAVLLLIALIVGWRQLTQKRVTNGYEPIVKIDDGWFRSKVVAGYRIQLFYDGIPIGDPTERMVYQANRVDKEAIEKAVNGALQVAQASLEAVSGVPFKTIKTVAEAISEATSEVVD